MTSRPQRTLAALLAADVIGYSALMESDEVATLARLKEVRSRVMEPIIGEHAGRIFKLTGDGMFATFASVVQATEAALAIQDAIENSEASAMRLRIGVHLGDVIIDGDDLYGDGVNLAARLEAIAPPGGVCVSASVYEHLSGPLAARFDSAGERKVKNISRPISTFVWQPNSAAPGAVSQTRSADSDHKPTVVLNSFSASGADQDAAALASAVTDAVTAALSGMTGLLVLLDDADSPDYLVTGTIQVRGTRCRATVHLTDGATRTHVWSRRFDGELADLFDAEDELAYRITNGIRSVLGRLGFERGDTRPIEVRGTEQLLAKHPEITVAAIDPLPFQTPEPWERFKEGLRNAGLPEVQRKSDSR